MLCYYAKANNKYMKYYDKYGWQCHRRCLYIFFKWAEIYLNLVKVIENYDEDRNERYFLEVDVQYPENVHNLLLNEN